MSGPASPAPATAPGGLPDGPPNGTAEMPLPRQFWRTRYWRAPDAVLAAAGAEAELVVARARLAVAALLSITPAAEAARGGDILYRLGFYVALVALGVALVVYLRLRRAESYRRWTPFATSALDVTLVTFALWAYAVVMAPAAALNSKATFDIYYLAVVAASLRYDRRVCVVAGMLAIAEYVALAAWSVPRLHATTTALTATFGDVRLGDQVARVIMLGAATALSAELVRRAGRLQYLSTRDRLTRLVNRGFFENRAAAELARARRENGAMAVAMLDVDFFKKFNDVYGHDVGDAVLRTVAGTLASGVRPSDVAARYGGEEFVVLLPGARRAEAAAMIERLRAAVEATPVKLPPRDGPRGITVSAGVAAYPEDGEDTAALVLRADERLYAAKQGGRNRVVSA